MKMKLTINMAVGCILLLQNKAENGEHIGNGEMEKKLCGIQRILDPKILILKFWLCVEPRDILDPEILQWSGILWIFDFHFYLRHKSACWYLGSWQIKSLMTIGI